MRQLRQRDAAGIAANHHIDLFVGGELLDRRDSLLGVFRFVGNDDFQLSSEQPALGVDFIGRHLGCVLGVAPHLKPT